MFYITYCGYVDILIMSLTLALNFLLILILILIIIFILNNSSLLLSLKIFTLGFFGDLELSFTIWNLLFLILVLRIRFRVLFFSFSYMQRIPIINFIIIYLSFVFRMGWLILNNNFYWIILGWDGLGVVSFLLIIYYRNLERVTNGLFTLFQNRLGDLFFVIFMLGLINYSIGRGLILKCGVLFVILGRAVKRAQYPFNAWLLAAISAPTPISSLVHSSTLVVAGIYILLQYSYCLREFLSTLKYLSLLTLVLRTGGLVSELDIKKLIAFSTIRHVSLIIFLLSQELYKIVYFHLRIHAIFKSLIFIAFGFLILSSFHAQDKRLVTYVGLNPQILIFYYFSCLCLLGLPFLTGFFSKDFIIEKLIEFNMYFFDIFLLLLFLSVRIYYSVKLLKLNCFQYSQILIEKQWLGILRLLFIVCFNMFLLNIYISLVFSTSLEQTSSKFFIYLLIFMFALLRALTNINFKIFNYSKILRTLELKKVNWHLLDLYVYFSLFDLVQKTNSLNRIKLIFLSNWWVIILFIYFV